MSLAKLLYPVVCAGLLVCNHAAQAEVYDFGNMQAFDAAPFAQLPLAESKFDTPSRQGKNLTPAYDDWGKWHGSGLSDDNLNNLYSMAQGGGEQASAAPAAITSYAPEPESYAMIVAGLGLIVFTARHRK